VSHLFYLYHLIKSNMSSLTVSIIQPNLVWEDKQANLANLSEKINNIPKGTELVVIPEMFSTGFSMKPEALAEDMSGETIQWMKDIAARLGIILTGSLIIKEDGNYYNRLIWMLPNGTHGCYDKRHMFAFGKEDQHYTAGNKRLIGSVKGWRINLQVCYDLRFPVWARQRMQQPKSSEWEYDMLVYVANWPERRNHAWKTLLQARAIENQCYVIGVNRVGNDGNDIYHSGDSMIINPLGAVLYHKEHQEDVYTHTFKKQQLMEIREKFPFWKDEDDFTISL
jgi:omega-amidase